MRKYAKGGILCMASSGGGYRMDKAGSTGWDNYRGGITTAAVNLPG